MSNVPKWELGPVKLVNGLIAVIRRFCEKRQMYLGEIQDRNGSWSTGEWNSKGWYIPGALEKDPHNLVPPPKRTMRIKGRLYVYNDKTVVFAHDDDITGQPSNIGLSCSFQVDRLVEEGEGL